MAESQPLPEAPCGAEYLRAVLRSPVYEVAQVTPLQVMEKILLVMVIARLFCQTLPMLILTLESMLISGIFSIAFGIHG